MKTEYGTPLNEKVIKANVGKPICACCGRILLDEYVEPDKILICGFCFGRSEPIIPKQCRNNDDKVANQSPS